ncbi:GerMN domain-containing protein [Candidatus Uhrbacteria bacterium]|nr:GerMN domain-containing protein [Candidatus Uhrbacteria bacterium]
MPSPKSKPNTKPSASDGAGYRLSGFLIIVAFAALGLVWLWLQLPKKNEPPTPRPPVVQPVPSTSPAKASCKEDGGTWIDCGLAPGCKADEPCAQVCVPQCLANPIPEPQPQPEPTTPVRAQPADTICDSRNFICVEDSVDGSLLASPFIVKGTGLAFENTINWRLLDANGGVIEKGFVTADAPDIGKAGAFEIRAFILQLPKTSTGTLEVLEYSAKDGSPTHVVKIPVRLPTTSMKTKFYMSTVSDTDCSEVTPIEMDVTRSGLPVETALRALLAVGPTMSSKRTAIPPDTRLISLKVSGGTATVVLSPELGNYGGGSCNVQAIRAQIESTLKQFPSVRNVVISQQGKTPEESLQP